MSCPAAVQVNATQNVEARICERLHIGGHISYRRLLEDLAGMGFSSNQVGGVGGDRLAGARRGVAASFDAQGGQCVLGQMACGPQVEGVGTQPIVQAGYPWPIHTYRTPCVLLLLLLLLWLLLLQVGLAVKVMLSRGQLRRKAEGKMLERCQ